MAWRAVLGILLFGEPADGPRLVGTGLNVAGILGLKPIAPH